MVCGAECMMSGENCPPGAVVIVLVNCIVDGSRNGGKSDAELFGRRIAQENVCLVT